MLQKVTDWDAYEAYIENKEGVCPDCDGTGVIVIPAYQRGGEIVDEVEQPCICQKKVDYVEYDPINNDHFTYETRDDLRTVKDSLMFAVQNINKGHSDDAIADIMFAHSKISELLNPS